MATIIIKRPSEYNNRFRNYLLFLDGKKIGTIANGQVKEFQTTAGQHTMVAKIDWCSSPEIVLTLNDFEEKQLNVGSFKNGNRLIPVAMGVMVLHLLLSLAFNFNYGFIANIPAFILLLYYLTAGRKKYLAFTPAEANPI